MNAVKKSATLQDVAKRIAELTPRAFEQGRMYLEFKQTRSEISQSVRQEIQKSPPAKKK